MCSQLEVSATGSEDDFVTSVDAIVGKELELTSSLSPAPASQRTKIAARLETAQSRAVLCTQTHLAFSSQRAAL
eukprot:2722823-Rhodomonas_salina.2